MKSSCDFQVPWHVPCGGVCYGDGNLGFIANDWHTALLPVYLKAYYRDNGLMTYARSTLVIHNMAHQVGSFSTNPIQYDQISVLYFRKLKPSRTDIIKFYLYMFNGLLIYMS